MGGEPAANGGGPSRLQSARLVAAVAELGSRRRSRTMRFTLFIFVVALVAGCARDDARLQGTWRSNREATVAAAFQRDPRWTNAAPEKVERFGDMFGHMTITYSKGTCLLPEKALW